MKTTLKVARILTWFNLIFWGFFLGLFLLSFLSVMYLPGVAILVLMGAVPLNCYAALKLHQSIRNSAIPLSQQTPTGIRFVGFIPVFLGVYLIWNGITMIGSAGEILHFIKDFDTKEFPDIAQMPAFKSMGISDVRAAGVICLILGLCMAVNVVLNLRLLRWYLLLRKNDAT
jgi:hypothetical protein